jgi:hypothetical protein
LPCVGLIYDLCAKITHFTPLGIISTAISSPSLPSVQYLVNHYKENFIICFCTAKGKCAEKSLQWLRGEDTDISHELREIENTHNESVKNPSGSTFELFNKSNIKPLLISLGLMFFQQMSGINAVVFYTVMIFEVRKFILKVLYFTIFLYKCKIWYLTSISG